MSLWIFSLSDPCSCLWLPAHAQQQSHQHLLGQPGHCRPALLSDLHPGQGEMRALDLRQGGTKVSDTTIIVQYCLCYILQGGPEIIQQYFLLAPRKPSKLQQ